MMFRRLIIFVLVTVFAWSALGVPPAAPSPESQLNSSVPIQAAGRLNTTDNASTVGSRIYSVVRDLPTLKNIVIFVCVLSAFLVIVLVIRIYRSGRRMRKTRKYDIITTPAERVEMEPLNEENDDEEDSTLFDIKYR